MLDGRCLMLENKWLKAHGTWLKVKDCDPGYHQEENVIIKTLTVGPIMANCFVVGCEETLESAVIDPGDEPDRILQALAESNLTAKLIINTHGHFDHVGANKRLKEVTSAPILIHPFDAPMLNQLADSAAAWGMAADNSPPPDRELQDGDEVAFGKIILKVLHTPGHTPGGISLYTDHEVFVGDTLFAGSIGRTDFPGGSFETLKESIQQKLFALSDDLKVYPGHNQATTIGVEKRTNPFVGEQASYFS
ncbi:MBL-fold metallo-hydrolase superfamily [Olavius sp. associated proteobacterium Delta 1]|nr:MBL-fold metallo-hydrolase superfamily [Olavius sp. associated proteobacterium Delta 1]